ncbi:prohead protease/major capsid protein fusion protein [Methylocystis sp. SC2]|uniref:prohead protease/major capsid protein fusion protein n=1 Tax=Methylocystis sp. (strain SC2) TaxID=187303 RepID=UPI00027AEEA5|nr:prohead protease/major capsid protein fusion protein [Methylocystis sp. SC2]CCJ08216.1 Peptidase U35 phage prohead HK97 [Methylocystis sp. SC2]
MKAMLKKSRFPSPPLAPVEMHTSTIALMTRESPRENAARKGPPGANQSRAVSLSPGSYDKATRTFQVVLSTGATVKRFGFNEELAIDPAAVDLSRVGLGQVKFLDSHNQGSASAVLGTITSARFEAGRLVGTVELSTSEAARALEPDIASGHLRGVSIGYRVDQWTNVSAGDVETWRADKWALMEASLVAVPADAGALVRSAPSEDDDRGRDMPSAMTARQAMNLIDRADFYGERELAERMVRQGHDEATVMQAVQESRRRAVDVATSIGGPRANLHEEMSRAALGDRSDENHRGRSYMPANAQTLDNPHFVRQSLEDALYARMTGKPPEGAARQFIGAPLSAYDDILAEASGERRSWLSRGHGRWFGGERGMHTTSDFPNLLLGSGNRVLQDQYQVAQSPLLLLGRQRQSADFRPVNVLKVSEAPALEEVKESGEVTYGSRGEEKEAFSVKTFAKIFSLSRQAYTNDDLGAFAEFLQAFGRAAAETEAKQMVALFTVNSGNGANLSDGQPLFTTGRGNKAASGAAIDVTTLSNARKALRETKGLDGVTPIGLTPRYILVGPAYETIAEQVISQIQANQVSNANPFSGKLDVLVEPRFTGNAWRVFADPAQQAIVSYAYLNGRSGPILETREGWTTLGVEFRAVLDFGCGATDWRGAYLNAGA